MNTKKTFFTLLKNAHVIAPEDLGVKDILVAGEKIAMIGEGLSLPAIYDCEVVDCEGNYVVPGFIDSHVHLIGGGGEGGYATRTPEIQLTDITTSGVTTVLGLLGTDGVTRHVASLLAKARGLEDEGITAYIYSGSYEIPTPTITGSVRNDIILIDKVIGTGEIAMCDHRSSQSPKEAYQQITAEARVGGMLSGKAGVVNMHLGDGEDGLKMLYEITKNGEIPKTQIIPTHVNRNKRLFKEAIEWAKQGGIMDVTSSVSPESGSSHSVKSSEAVKQALEAGVNIENITMSSDGNGSMPIFDEAGNNIGVGVASQISILNEFRDMMQKENIAITDAIKIITSNIAKFTKLYPRKGCLANNSDADILVLDKDLQLQHVWARGTHMVENGKPIVFGTFEKR
ncbi:beta-aspartyl-peptidase [Megamonas funiformis]|jgi:beta-aspartyl-dipeptidase (metallo-type)|uniref:Isoaspartyl dipeptidase n=1 Tax=Megamonas funiformis YIT 11815 TaxID=742816 RepID=A0ABP2NN00_9FIRM|nr:beta-aspartyl-peptidase [Megamonas funiformis]EHR38685.1 beta-aspartyl peptidase [Megamonas funiformis YIT 11815]QIB60177.1 beta-aspartyl-peptidase [Megamonas funiformis]